MLPSTFALRPKLPDVGITIFTTMSRLALEHGAINLAQGFPDFPAPEVVKEAAVAAIRADVNQYAVTWGAPSFREALARKIERFSGRPVEADRELVVTCGSTEAMMAMARQAPWGRQVT